MSTAGATSSAELLGGAEHDAPAAGLRARALLERGDDLAREIDADDLAGREPRLEQIEHDAAAGPDLDDPAGLTQSSMRSLSERAAFIVAR